MQTRTFFNTGDTRLLCAGRDGRLVKRGVLRSTDGIGSVSHRFVAFVCVDSHDGGERYRVRYIRGNRGLPLVMANWLRHGERIYQLSRFEVMGR